MKTAISVVLALVILSGGPACKKGASSSGGSNNNGGGTGNTVDSVYNPVDPSTPASIGLFGSNWQGKTFAVPGTVSGSVPAGTVSDTLTINVNKVLVKVPAYVYGN